MPGLLTPTDLFATGSNVQINTSIDANGVNQFSFVNPAVASSYLSLNKDNSTVDFSSLSNSVEGLLSTVVYDSSFTQAVISFVEGSAAVPLSGVLMTLPNHPGILMPAISANYILTNFDDVINVNFPAGIALNDIGRSKPILDFGADEHSDFVGGDTLILHPGAGDSFSYLSSSGILMLGNLVIGNYLNVERFELNDGGANFVFTFDVANDYQVVNFNTTNTQARVNIQEDDIAVHILQEQSVVTSRVDFLGSNITNGITLDFANGIFATKAFSAAGVTQPVNSRYTVNVNPEDTILDVNIISMPSITLPTDINDVVNFQVSNQIFSQVSVINDTVNVDGDSITNYNLDALSSGVEGLVYGVPGLGPGFIDVEFPQINFIQGTA